MTKITALKSGLRIVTEKKPFNKVCLGVYVKVGMRNEPDNLNGISHFLEHMAFKGTKTKTAQQLVEDLEFCGASCNAYTSDDHTAYSVECLPENWKTGIDFLSDIIQNSTFPQEELEKERNVILQELMRSEDDFNSTMWNTISKTVFENQPLGRTILGPKENIKKITREDLIKYIKDGYVADRIIISACGNVSHREFVKYVKEKFNNLNTDFQLPDIECTYKKKDTVELTKFDQANVMILHEDHNLLAKDMTLNSLYSLILDGGMSTRLFQNVREKHGLGYSVFSLGTMYEDTAYKGVSCSVESGDIDKTVAVLKETVLSMTENVSEKELEKAKNSFIFSLASKYDSCSFFTTRNAMCLLYNKPIKTIEELKEETKKISVTDIIKFAKEITKNGFSTIIIKSEKED